MVEHEPREKIHSEETLNFRTGAQPNKLILLSQHALKTETTE